MKKLFIVLLFMCLPVSVSATDYGYISGDSTSAAYAGTTSVATYLAALIPYTIFDRAAVGASIADQKTTWDGQDAGIKTGVAWIAVLVGHNDLNPAVATATTISAYQSLITTMNAEAPQARIHIATMVPCKAFLITTYGAIDGATAYQKWLDINTAISGLGASPITGHDGYMGSHTTALNDGSGNLAVAYDTGDGIHENNAGRQIIAAAWAKRLTVGTQASFSTGAVGTLGAGSLVTIY